jgi:sialic acid synthase SpsE
MIDAKYGNPHPRAVAGFAQRGGVDVAWAFPARGYTVVTKCATTDDLRMIDTLGRQFPCPIGYSGHEVGLQATFAAVAMGATFVERHITLDRTMWGTDQAASVEPGGFVRLLRDIRIIEQAIGDGVKRVYASELPVMKKLRRVPGI